MFLFFFFLNFLVPNETTFYRGAAIETSTTASLTISESLAVVVHTSTNIVNTLITEEPTINTNIFFSQRVQQQISKNNNTYIRKSPKKYNNQRTPTRITQVHIYYMQ